MAELKTYKTPGAFKSALAERLRSRAKAVGVPTDRARARPRPDRLAGHPCRHHAAAFVRAVIQTHPSVVPST
jgi:hypothetical protein